jgi:hypothetical protein
LCPIQSILSLESDYVLTGIVFSKGNTETGIQENNNLALAIADERANFTEIKRVLDYLS